MKINRDTYESFFIDYLDGNLSDLKIQTLINFLDKNPDLEEELRDLTSFSKKNTSKLNLEVSFKSENLKKEYIFEENESNFDELCISFYEGLLNEKEEHYLLELTETRDDLLAIFESYGQTKIKTDLSITYPYKSSLKKYKKVLWHPYLSYAASVILIIGFIFYIQKDADNNLEINSYNLSNHSYMDYPKVDTESFKKQPPKDNNLSVIDNNLKPLEVKRNTILKQNPISKAEKKILVSYDQEVLDNFEKNNPLSYSRKGKLAYSNLSELDNYLNELFAKKQINKGYLPDEDVKKNTTQKNQANLFFALGKYNSSIQLATSIEPLKYQKRILGSQPIK